MPALESPAPSAMNPLALESLSASGKPPKSRLSDSHHALTLVRQMIEGNKARLRKNVMIQGMADGNPPYNSEKLKAAGQAWRTNISTLEGKAHISSAAAPYYDLFDSVPCHVDVQLDFPNPALQPQASRIVSEAMDRTLRRWRGFTVNMWKVIYDFVTFGKGFVMWPDKMGWKFRHVSTHNFLFPDGSGVDFDTDQELIIIRQSLKIHELYRYIKDPAAAESVGWKVETTRQSIMNARPKTQTDYQDWELVQQTVRDHDLYSASRSSTVQVAHIYVREFDGKWTHGIIDENLLVKDSSRQYVEDGGFKSGGWLFFRTGQFSEISEFVCPFIFEVLAGTINGISGIGKDIYAIMAAKDKLRCSQFDNLMMRQSITMKALTASAVQKLALVQFGPFNVIPPDFEVQQSTIFGDIESSLAVNRDLDGMVQANTGIYRPRIETGPGNPETATEVQLRFSQATVLSSSATNRFYTQLDRMYQETYRRLCTSGDPDAKAFREYCNDRGIPDEFLKKVESVRAYRNIGNGSVSQRQQALVTLFGIAPSLPETGRANLIDDLIATTSGESKVDRYNPKDPEQATPQDQVWQATMENDNLANGSPVILTPTQNDLVHAQTHLGAAAQALQSVQQGADPAKVLKFVDGVGQHSIQHIQRLAADPTRKQAVALLQDQWKKLAEVADEYKAELQQQAQQQQQLQKQGQELDGKLQLKAMETQAKIGMQQQKTDAALAMKQQKHNADMAMRGQSHTQDMALKDASTATGITLAHQKQKAHNAIQMANAKAQQAASAQDTD